MKNKNNIVDIENEVKKYLKKIKFEKNRLPNTDISPKFVRELLKEQLEKYFKGNISSEFIIKLGEILHWEIGVTYPEIDKELLGMTCDLNDLAGHKNSKEKINRIFSVILDDLNAKLKNG